LTGKGLAKDKIKSTEAKGEANPAVLNDSEENRKLNRRVEFEIYELK